MNPKLPQPTEVCTSEGSGLTDAAEKAVIDFACVDGVIHAVRGDLEPVLPRLAAALRSGMRESASGRLSVAEPASVVWAMLYSSLGCGSSSVHAALRASSLASGDWPATVDDTAARCGAAIQLGDEWMVPRLEGQAASLLRRLMDENPALAATTASFAVQGPVYTELASISLAALTVQFERAARAVATEHGLDLQQSHLTLCDLFCKLCALESGQHSQ